MKKKFSLLAVIFMLISSVSTSAVADLEFGLCPYVGIDVQVRHIGFKRDLGSNLFKKNYIQGNPFLGLRFNDFLGVELGWEQSLKKHASVANPNRSIELGVPTTNIITPHNINLSTNTFRIFGPHANIVGYLPFCICDGKFDFFASVGIAWLRAKLSHQPTGTEISSFNSGLMQSLKVRFNKQKAVLRLGTGLQYMMTEHAGVRISLVWENTSRFKRIVPNNPNPITVNGRVGFKDSFNYGLGLFWQF